MGRLVALVFIAAALGLVAVSVFFGEREQKGDTSLSVAEALSSDTTGFERAVHPRPLRFPGDHGPHPGFRTEWWYYTGNLESPDGHHFGYQLTIFRTALRPDTSSSRQGTESESTDSTWSTRQLYMAHFAVSDAASGRFTTAERFSRGAAGLAGAQAEPFRVWLEDWSIRGADADSVHMAAADDQMAVDLALVRTKPIVLHGDEGLDTKGPEPGNASYYYSMTRFRTEGTVTVDGSTYPVRGQSWMDHEWSTSVLGRDQIGWDWFALQLDSGREIMFYRLRTASGGASPFSGGVIVDSTGGVTRLDRSDVELASSNYWKSPETGNRYPITWTIRIPAHGLNLRLEPFLQDQELVHSVTYWEGAVRVTGTESGVGFVELTGYGASEGRLSAP